MAGAGEASPEWRYVRAAHRGGLPGMAELKQVESLLVIGTGSAGCRHLMNAEAAGVENLSVLSASTERRKLSGNVRVETDLGSALSRKPGAVVIANQTSLHINSALAVVRAGCHVLVEKPLSDTWAGVEDLRLEVQDRSLVTMVGYQFR